MQQGCPAPRLSCVSCPAPVPIAVNSRSVTACPAAEQTILDQQGCAGPHLSLIRNGLLVVARDEGLYDFTLDTRAGVKWCKGGDWGHGRAEPALRTHA